jgi:hypothetical protein
MVDGHLQWTILGGRDIDLDGRRSKGPDEKRDEERSDDDRYDSPRR